MDPPSYHKKFYSPRKADISAMAMNVKIAYMDITAMGPK